MLLFLIVAFHVFTYEYEAGTPRAEWFSQYNIRTKDTERFMLYVSTFLARKVET